MAVEELDRTLERIRLPPRVVVREGDVPGVGQSDAGVASDRADVVRQPDDLDLRIGRLDGVRRAVRRTVVDQDYRAAVPTQCVEEFQPAVAADHDSRHGRREVVFHACDALTVFSQSQLRGRRTGRMSVPSVGTGRMRRRRTIELLFEGLQGVSMSDDRAADQVNPVPDKDPADWTTGEEPMTGPQASYLRTLAQEAGEEPPPDNLTKAEASQRIDELQARTGRGGA